MEIGKYIGNPIDHLDRFPFDHWDGNFRMIPHDGITPIEKDGRINEHVFCHSLMISFESCVPPLPTDKSAGLMLDDDAVGMPDPMGSDELMIDVRQDLR